MAALTKWGVIGDSCPFPPEKGKECSRQFDSSDDAVDVPSSTPQVKPNQQMDSMRENFSKAFPDIFKEDLNEDDFILHEIQIEVKEDVDINPLNVMTPTTLPVHLRKAADLELKKCLAAGVLEPVEHSTSLCSRSFFVPKPSKPGDPLRCRLVSDFCILNQYLK